MGDLAVLIPALLHVFPQRDHLGTEFGTATDPTIAFGCMAKEEEATLLLEEDYLFLFGAGIVAVCSAVGVCCGIGQTRDGGRYGILNIAGLRLLLSVVIISLLSLWHLLSPLQLQQLLLTLLMLLQKQ